MRSAARSAAVRRMAEDVALAPPVVSLSRMVADWNLTEEDASGIYDVGAQRTPQVVNDAVQYLEETAEGRIRECVDALAAAPEQHRDGAKFMSGMSAQLGWLDGFAAGMEYYRQKQLGDARRAAQRNRRRGR